MTKAKTYVGPIPELKGFSALVMTNAPYGVVAQFTKIETGLAFGWWQFHDEEFADEDEYEETLKRLKERSGYSHNAAIRKACELLCTLRPDQVPTPRYNK